MIIRVKDLVEGVSSVVTCDYDAEKIDVEFADLHYASPIHFQAEMCVECSTLHVWGQLTGRIEQVCARCLKEEVSEVRSPVDLFYDVKEIEEVNVLDDVREILILSHDPKFLCRPDCRGLCAGCGADLNVESCLCSFKKL